MKLTKFPIVMPDGSQFRIKMVERLADEYTRGDYIIVKIQARRKYFGYRTLYYEEYVEGYSIYERANPYYVALTTSTLVKYFNAVKIRNRMKAQEEKAALIRTRAQQHFADWNGIINEEDSP